MVTKTIGGVFCGYKNWLQKEKERLQNHRERFGYKTTESYKKSGMHTGYKTIESGYKTVTIGYKIRFLRD
jgi:hypothetical protein